MLKNKRSDAPRRLHLVLEMPDAVRDLVIKQMKRQGTLPRRDEMITRASLPARRRVWVPYPKR